MSPIFEIFSSHFSTHRKTSFLIPSTKSRTKKNCLEFSTRYLLNCTRLLFFFCFFVILDDNKTSIAKIKQPRQIQLIPGTKSQTLFLVRDLVPGIKNEVFRYLKVK